MIYVPLVVLREPEAVLAQGQWQQSPVLVGEHNADSSAGLFEAAKHVSGQGLSLLCFLCKEKTNECSALASTCLLRLTQGFPPPG